MSSTIVPASPYGASGVDFMIEVGKGNVSGHSLVHKFGRNLAVPNGSWAFVNTLGNSNGLRASATTVRIAAGGNAADTAAGAGARQITVQGIDSSGNEVTNTLATAGASASSASSSSFWRVHRAWVSSAGTRNAANTGNVTIENSAGGTNLIRILAGEGQSQYAGYTIPTGYTGHLLSAHAFVDSNKTADVRCFTRKEITTAAAPFKAKRLKLYWDGIAGTFAYVPITRELILDGLEDIWFEAYGDGAVSQVSIDFEILLIQD